jgi:hypothetical protein
LLTIPKNGRKQPFFVLQKLLQKPLFFYKSLFLFTIIADSSRLLTEKPNRDNHASDYLGPGKSWPFPFSSMAGNLD